MISYRFRTLQETRDEFNKVAEVYDKLPIAANNDQSWILDNLPCNKECALDVGCGTGSSLLMLAQNFKFVVGIDISEMMLEKAQYKCKEKSLRNAHVVIGNVEQLPILSTKFDFVISHTTLHHCADLKSAFFELKRLLNIGGKLIVVDIVNSSLTGVWPRGSMQFIALLRMLHTILKYKQNISRWYIPRIPQGWLQHQSTEYFYSIKDIKLICNDLLPGAKIDTYFAEYCLTKLVKIEWINREPFSTENSLAVSPKLF